MLKKLFKNLLALAVFTAFVSSFNAMAAVGDLCTTDTDCETGYKCLPSNPLSASSEKVCYVSDVCKSDSECDTNYKCRGINYKAGTTKISDYGICEKDPIIVGECDANTPCAAGFVCEKGIGASAKGSCVPNAITKVLCNITLYFNEKLVITFMLFSSVMLGLAFFLGKISWGMIMTIFLGTGLIYSAEQLIIKVTGVSKDGFCGFDVNIESACNKFEYSPKETSSNTGLLFETTAYLNTESEASVTGCDVPFSCMKVQCQTLEIDAVSKYCSSSGGEYSTENWAVGTTYNPVSVVTSYASKFNCPPLSVIELTGNGTCKPKQGAMTKYFRCTRKCPSNASYPESVEYLYSSDPTKNSCSNFNS